MQAELITATPDQKATMLQLMELYCYDYSEFVTWPIGEDGHFCNMQRYEARWNDTDIEKLFVRVNGELAGFVWLSDSASVVDGFQAVHDVEEFCILRGYWRRGIGRHVVQQVFQARPGQWEIRVMRENQRALAFWRSVLGSVTGGHFRESERDDERWQGVLFSFDSQPQ